LGEKVYCFGCVDGFGTDVRVVKELACTEEIWEEGIVIETPNAMGACRFEEIQRLDSSGKCKISKSEGTLGTNLLKTTSIRDW
jgi:hypothetical protein